MSLLALVNRRNGSPPTALQVGDHHGTGVVGAIHPSTREPIRARGRWTEMPGRTRRAKRAFLKVARDEMKRRRWLREGS